MIMVFAAVGGFILCLIYRDKNNSRNYDAERNFQYSDVGTYGTACFEDPRNITDILEINQVEEIKGTILGTDNGEVVAIKQDGKLNRNIAVFGAPGSMKSRAFVRNMILQSVVRGESMVLTDPKSELYEDMSQYLEEQGYEVRVFNLVDPKHSDRWNCVAEIDHDQLVAQLCTDIIIKNTTSDKVDRFWDSSELNLLKALLLYVDSEKEPEERNMGQVYQMLSVMTEQELDARFAMLPKGHPAKAPYHIFKQAGEKIRGGIIVGLGSRLQVYQNQLVCEVTGQNDIDLTLPGKQKCAYFCITSDQDSTFDFLASLFFSFLFIKLVRYADGRKGTRKLPVYVNFILDEFAAIGAIPDFKKKLSTVRSRNIGVAFIFQNLAQLKSRYPNDEWQELLGNADTQIALGCNDEMTAKFISNRTGEVTIVVSSESKKLNTWRFSDYTPEYRETTSIGRRKLMTTDEVLRIPLDETLIILRGKNVFKLKKFDYIGHPESQKLKYRMSTDYNPSWYEELSQSEDRPIEKNEPQSDQQTVKQNEELELLMNKEFNIRTKDDIMS